MSSHGVSQRRWTRILFWGFPWILTLVVVSMTIRWSEGHIKQVLEEAQQRFEDERSAAIAEADKTARKEEQGKAELELAAARKEEKANAEDKLNVALVKAGEKADDARLAAIAEADRAAREDEQKKAKVALAAAEKAAREDEQKKAKVALAAAEKAAREDEQKKATNLKKELTAWQENPQSALSHDGKILAQVTGTRGNEITLLDVSGGMIFRDVMARPGDVMAPMVDKPLPLKSRKLNEHSNRVVAIAFSPDDKVLFSSSLDGSIMAWDMSKWKEKEVGKDGRDPLLMYQIPPKEGEGYALRFIFGKPGGLGGKPRKSPGGGGLPSDYFRAVMIAPSGEQKIAEYKIDTGSPR